MKEPKIRLKEFCGKWIKNPLSKIATMHARIGWQNLRREEYLSNGEFYLITGTDFIDGNINYKKCHYVEEERYNQDKNIQLNNGSILITKDGTLGKVAYVENLDKPATLNAGVFNVVCKNNDIDSRFLFQYLKSPLLMEYVNSTATGGTIKHLNQNILVNFPVYFPELKEQIFLGSYFKYLDSLIQSTTKKIESLKQVKAASLQSMFPQEGETKPRVRFKGFEEEWNTRILGSLGNVAMCKRIFKEQTSNVGEIPFFKIGTFGAEPDAFISRELYLDYKTRFNYPQKGDILISAAGTIGRIVEYLGEEVYFQDSNIVWLNHNDEIENSFLKYLYSIITWKGLEGATIKRLYNNIILETEIKLPSNEEQRAIGEYFQNLDTQITLQAQRLEKLKQIKSACLDNMFV